MVDVIALCKSLVAAPSENPPGGEQAVAAIAANLLSGASFEVSWHEAAMGRPNIVARLRRGDGVRLIFQAHADTKPAVPQGTQSLWTTDPFQAEERDGLLYGLGTCDTKGGLAAQLAAAVGLAGERGWCGELMVQVVADEEDGSKLGAEYLLGIGLLNGAGAIVSEPTGCEPSLAQLGNAWAEVTIVGRAAHAGTPNQATSAFRAAIAYVSRLDSIVAQAAPDERFPNHPQLNVGDMLMPGHPGTVPGECRLRCDIRVLPSQERDDVWSLYDVAAHEIRTEHGVTITVVPYMGGGCQSHQIGSNERLAQAFVASAEGLGRSSNRIAFSGGTDARYFAMAGTPALVYGPGSLKQAHAPNEFVCVSQLQFAEEHLKNAALAFFKGKF